MSQAIANIQLFDLGDWRAPAQELDQQLQVFGEDSIVAAFLEANIVEFIRQLLLSGRNMCRKLHNHLFTMETKRYVRIYQGVTHFGKA